MYLLGYEISVYTWGSTEKEVVPKGISSRNALFLYEQSLKLLSLKINKKKDFFLRHVTENHILYFKRKFKIFIWIYLLLRVNK